jgi:hypothetical protein
MVRLFEAFLSGSNSELEAVSKVLLEVYYLRQF